MKNSWLIVVLSGLHGLLFAQHPVDSIKESDAAAIIEILAADAMKGRANGSPEILKTGIFIGDRFKQAGLSPMPGQASFYLPFTLPAYNPSAVTDMLEWNGEIISPGRFMYFPSQPGNHLPKELKDFTVIHQDTCFYNTMLSGYKYATTPLLIWTSEMQPDNENYFPEWINLPNGGLATDILLVYATHPPDTVTLTGLPHYNIVGMLPGKSKPAEVIIFSAHYDHMGTTGFGRKDTIMNGANDDASGTTAVLMLADYFAKRNDNERTIIFCAFAGEELGLIGSEHFINHLVTENVVAVVNIEMIGISQLGKNNVFITGYNYSDLPALLEKNLKRFGIKVRGEPNQNKNLFERSDNFPFAKKGIPAHTVMSSDDDEPCYHKPCDEIKRINIKHMTQVIRSIAFATESLINSSETPGRKRYERPKLNFNRD